MSTALYGLYISKMRCVPYEHHRSRHCELRNNESAGVLSSTELEEEHEQKNSRRVCNMIGYLFW